MSEEKKRQKETITLIPSENYASKNIRTAVASVLANKYSEGYPGKRYYQGNKIIDHIEQIAIDRVKNVFGVPYANVQPYSGSPANLAVLLALLSPGDKIMGMKLSAGGHLTHGHKVSISGKFFNSVQFDVDGNGLINYEQMIQLAKNEKPKLIIVGTTAYPRILDWEKFATAADAAGAYLMADISHISGLVIGKVHPNPVPYVDIVMTTTHKILRGPRGAILMVTEKGLAKDPDLSKKIDKGVFPGIQGGPHENQIAGIAIAMDEVSKPDYQKYVQQVVKNAKILASELKNMKYDPVTGGTDNHLMVIDMRNKGISGKEAAEALEEAGIIVNANTIPHDPNPAGNPSGIRIGTPAVTTRGMKEAQMKQIAGMIDRVIRVKEYTSIKAEVKEMCRKFPIPE